VLGLDLVHAEDAGADPGTGVGDAEQLEQRLHRAVLATGAVEGDEGDVGPLLLEPRDEPLVGVDRDDLVTERGDGVLDPGAGRHRDDPLERAPALQHRDPHRSRGGLRLNGTTSPPVGSGPGGSSGRTTSKLCVIVS
jgi:hypothetical protein